MQAGHFVLSLTIATCDWSLPTALYSFAIQWLPNADALAIKAGWAKDDFHCSITHTFLFAFAVSGFVLIFVKALCNDNFGQSGTPHDGGSAQ